VKTKIFNSRLLDYRRKTTRENILQTYRSQLFKELFYLRQRDLSVMEYKLKFDELVFKYDFKIDHLPTTCVL